MGLATPSPTQLQGDQLSSTTQQAAKPAPSMSQGFHQGGLYSFSDGFDRAPPAATHGHDQQARRDKMRVVGVAGGGSFEPAPAGLVAMDEEEPAELPVYGMLSEMFNFPSAQPQAPGQVVAQPQEILVGGGQIPGLGGHGYRHVEWYEKRDRNHAMGEMSGASADSAAAMQLFLMNPQRRSPSPPPHPTPPPPPPLFHGAADANTAFSAAAAAGHFTWGAHDGGQQHKLGTVVDSQGLSLSLSSSLQAGKEELRIGEGMLYYGGASSCGGGMWGASGGGGGPSSSPSSYPMKNVGNLHLAGVAGGQTPAVHMGYGSMGMVNVLRHSKYAKAAQELLEEFCSVGRGQLKSSRHGRNPNLAAGGSGCGGGGGGSSSGAGGASSSSKEVPPLSPADRFEQQRRKAKLISMLDEVERRYNHYCEQMQMVVNSFDSAMGFGAATPYTALAQKAMSRHFRCLKDAVAAQLRQTCEMLGEKDAAGGSGITKGETPRLRILEQSLRQQRALHQMGMMEQEAWRPQRGLPERSVNILRAWLFEHFLHPYPSDADKHLLARQTGLSRNQVSNWFINARVRLWKPMVEEMYQQEAKDEEDDDKTAANPTTQTSTQIQTTTPAPATISSAPAAAASVSSAASSANAEAKRSDINARDGDISHTNINRSHAFHHHHHHHLFSSDGGRLGDDLGQFSGEPDLEPGDVAACFGAATGNMDVRYHGAAAAASTAATGDVSLTLGLRHAGNLPDKGRFPVDFGNR